MTLKILSGSPHEPQALALLQASHDLMDRLFPAESCHALSVDDLCQDHIEFFIAYKDDIVVGCVALANMSDYAEVKSMFVSENARGLGVSHELLEHIEDRARSAKLSIMRLETGHALEAAVKLYQKHGYQECGPFGSYVHDPLSLFMEKTWDNGSE
jgi:putative acetyltransferase